MSTAQATNVKDAVRVLTRWLLRALGAGTVIGVGLWLTYRTVEPRITASPHYNFDPRSITITPLPPWIHSDLKAEVLRDGSLDQPLNLLDDSLLERVAKAFALHPWVAQVTSVRKRAGRGVDVQLQYRRPVCMVEVPGGLFPVDAEGVLLPTADFSSDEAARYPRLTGVQTITEGPVGTRWADECVVQAAQIAAVLVDDWSSLGLNRLSPLAPLPPDSSAPITFVLYTQHGAPVIWGTAAAAPNSEPTAEQKRAHLKSIAAALSDRNGSSPPIDLRETAAATVTP